MNKPLLKNLGTVAVDVRMLHSSGIGVVLRELLRCWAAEDHDEFHLYGDPKEIEASIPEGLNAKVFPWTPKLYSVSSLMNPPKFQRDTAVCFSPHYATFLRPKLPFVVFIHDVLHITHPPRQGTKLFMQACLTPLRSSASYIITPSRHVKVQLQTLHGFEAQRVLHAPLGPGLIAGLDVSERDLPSELSGRDYMVSVGLYKPHKNWDFLLDRLAASKDLTLPLVCLGLGKEKSALRAAAEARGLGPDRLVILDYLEEKALAATYHHAKVLIHPSLAEGFGIPILEGMKAGVPVVHADRSPMKEITDGAGFAFDPDWPESFDGVLRTALFHEGARQSAIAKGKARAAVYTWDKTKNVVSEALYRAVTKKLP